MAKRVEIAGVLNLDCIDGLHQLFDVLHQLLPRDDDVFGLGDLGPTLALVMERQRRLRRAVAVSSALAAMVFIMR